MKSLTLSHLHRYKDIAFRPITVYLFPFFQKAKITPNYITAAGGVFIFLAIYFLYTSNHVIFVILTLLHFFADLLDGAYARYTEQVSKSGQRFDRLVDISSLFLIYVVTYLQTDSNSLSVLIIVNMILVLVELAATKVLKLDDENSPSRLYLYLGIGQLWMYGALAYVALLFFKCIYFFTRRVHF